MKAKIRKQLARRKRAINRRLDKSKMPPGDRPVFRASNIQYEIADRARGVAFGGIGAMQLLAQKLGLAEAIDSRLHLLKIHMPYHESDHVLNIAFNALSDGKCLEDLELLRNDEAYLDALGAQRIPDPTTAGDFCRRFHVADVHTLMEAIDQPRRKAWAQQPNEFFDVATIEMDGTLVPTTGECKQGMDISYKGDWGYHPLVVTLANTNEVLRIVNRPGNRPSHEGAAVVVDQSIDLCLGAGFRRVTLRGDTDFTQTRHLDRWDADGRIQFVFGIDAMSNLKELADRLPQNAWKRLDRPARYEVKTKPRARPRNVKESIVVQRGYENIRLVDEEVAEFDYRPTACKRPYRLVVVRKNLLVEKTQQVLFADYRYFFYITNDRKSSTEAIVFSANDRCDQENLISQLKGGVRSLRAPVDNLTSNWAYMVMASLAWNLKAWWALCLPVRKGRWAEKHGREKQTVLRMEFRTFVNTMMRMPCQIVRTGRKLVYRLLSYSRWQSTFFRLVDAFRQPWSEPVAHPLQC